MRATLPQGLSGARRERAVHTGYRFLGIPEISFSAKEAWSWNSVGYGHAEAFPPKEGALVIADIRLNSMTSDRHIGPDQMILNLWDNLDNSEGKSKQKPFLTMNNDDRFGWIYDRRTFGP